ncbi:caspase family protein [Gilvibacter sp.]|uniref:caspase family protein n=1 Tax=Gilvibacter sp. TaxID=2729997 RepID=UPI0035BEA22D
MIYAILGASNQNYLQSKNELKHCHKDVEAWLALIMDKYKLENSKIVLVRDVNHYEFKTKLDVFLSSIPPNEHGVLIYSGHGSRIMYMDDDVIIKEEAIRFLDKNFTESELAYAIDQFLHKDAKLTVILDSCYSGMIDLFKRYDELDDLEHYVKSIKAFQEDENVDSPKGFKKIEHVRLGSSSLHPHLVILAATEGELAYEYDDNERQNGVFTYHAVGLLNEKPSMSLVEMDDYLTSLKPFSPYHNQRPCMKYPETIKSNPLFIF